MTAPQQAQPPRHPGQHDMPLLGAIAGAIRWLEELVNLIAGPLLTIGLGIALVDLLTDGALLTAAPILLYAWAISQAVGVDAQLVASWDRARQAARERRWWALVGLVVLGLALAYVAWIAAQVFATQQSQHVSESAALAELGISPTVWLIQRTALSVFLVCLSGWTRYHPPAKVQVSAEEEREHLARELELEPLRQQLAQQKVGGFGRLARTAIAAARGKEEPPARPPTGPGTPRKAPVRTPDLDAPPAESEVPTEVPSIPALRPVRTGQQGKRTAASRAADEKRKRQQRERLIAAWLAEDPAIATRDLVRRLRRTEHSRVSESTVSELRHVVEARMERANGQAAQ